MPDYKKKPPKVVGHPNTAYVTPSAWLATILEREIERLDAECDGADERAKGGATILCENAARYYDKGEGGAVYRRLYDIRYGKVTATRCDLADALLLACGINMSQTELPTLPAGMAAAVEMVTIHSELNELDWDDLTIQREARAILDFTIDFLKEPSFTALDTFEAPVALVG